MNHWGGRGGILVISRNSSLSCCEGLEQGWGLGNQKEVLISPRTLLHFSYYKKNPKVDTAGFIIRLG